MSEALTPTLPAIRQELVLLPAPRGRDGAPRWFLHDPVRHCFHSLGESAVKLLSIWQAAPSDDVLARAQAEIDDCDICEDDIKSLTEFLFENRLTIDPPGDDPRKFADQENAKRQPLHEMLVHKYLFIRIPLFNPQKFLARTERFTRPLFHRLTWQIIAGIGAVGLLFAARQWDSFIRTFLHFFTMEGFVFYALSLTVIKALHELGHAFAARHYGCRVPVIGLAFLVMFPILYTDTTDAWRLTDRKARLFIDGAGMMVELAIACLSIFLWSFLPDGPLRSVAFFAATSSWLMSLLVNLNPFMRFDGYYLLSDFFGLHNLQKQGFEQARWHMRETLFGLGEPAPVQGSRALKFGLTSYAYGTWVYRFFLFIGIAILVHHLFPKALGIVLFTVEILFFIITPMWRELKVWGGKSMTILSTTRGRISLSVFAALTAAFFIPWQTSARVPALLSPGLSNEVFAPAPAYIDALMVKNGEIVERGQILARLSAPHLAHERKQSRERLALIDAQLERLAANLTERRFSTVLIDSRAKEMANLSAIDNLQNTLIIRAPYTGRVTALEPSLHSGRYVKPTRRLMRVIGTKVSTLTLYPQEHLLARIEMDAPIKFISDDPLLPKLKAQVTRIAPTSVDKIEDRVLTSQGGGAIAVYEGANGALIPERQVFRLDANVITDTPLTIGQHRGSAHIKLAGESPAAALRRSVMRVLIREVDF